MEEPLDPQSVDTRMADSIARSPEALALLLELARVLGSTLDGGRLSARTVGFLGSRLVCDVVVLLLLDPQAQVLRVARSFGVAEPRSLRSVVYGAGEGLVGAMFDGGPPTYVPDLAREPRFTHFRGTLRMTGSAVFSPILLGGRPVGALVLGRSHADGFPPELRALIAAAVDQLGPAIRNSRVHERTRALASFDSLTGLTNRHRVLRSLDQEWKRYRRFGNPLSVIMVDIDHFKTFNDRCGHLFGDRVLQRVAHTLRDTVREVDLVGRYGGDEFVVVLPNTTLEHARKVAEKLRQAVEDRCVVRRQARPEATSVTITLGIAEARADTKGMKELLDEADRRLLESKVGGRNRVGARE